MSDNALTTIYYDPEGRLLAPIQQAIPFLQSTFDIISVLVSKKSDPETVAFLEQSGCSVVVREEATEHDVPPVGLYRRTAVSNTLSHNPNHIMYCDFDRATHWANFYPEELKTAVSRLPEHDFWVYGRSERAFYSHPPSMTRTESMINDLFAQVSGLQWDVLAATRGMSAEVAQFIVNYSNEDTFGNDPAWPLLVQKNGRFSLGYIETEGMEFETADAFPNEIAAAGGLGAWHAQNEQSLDTWLYRLKATIVEIEAIRPFIIK